MPHFVLEYSRDVEQSADIPAVMKTVQDVADECDFMNVADVKIRAKAYDHFLMPSAGQSFLHVTVYLLSGRSDDMKESLAISLREKLTALLPTVTSVSFDIRDMNRTAYKKRVLG
jgi:5-carboxymethyl-2-hydroxymuconate isomerase